MSYKNVLVKSWVWLLLRPRSLGCDHVISLQCTHSAVLQIASFQERCIINQTYCIWVQPERTRHLNGLIYFLSSSIGSRWWENVAESRTPASLQFSDALVPLSGYHNSDVADPSGPACSSRLFRGRQATPPASCNRISIAIFWMLLSIWLKLFVPYFNLGR
jgi:hypothetical protein